MYFLLLCHRSRSLKHLYNTTPSSWRPSWRATSPTPCPTVSFTSAFSSSVTRSWRDTSQRSAIYWTSWSLCFSTWWRAALSRANCKVTKGNNQRNVCYHSFCFCWRCTERCMQISWGDTWVTGYIYRMCKCKMFWNVFYLCFLMSQMRRIIAMWWSTVVKLYWRITPIGL